MKVLTVFAHPGPRTFCHAVLERFRAGLRDAGHEVDLADLYAEKFDPVFRANDMAFYLDESIPGFIERMQLRERIGQQAGGPLLHHRKALIINTTFFRQEDYEPHFTSAMGTTIDSWAFKYPGIKNVEHHYLWAVGAVGPEARERYLEQTYALGRNFEPPLSQPVAGAIAEA